MICHFTGATQEAVLVPYSDRLSLNCVQVTVEEEAEPVGVMPTACTMLTSATRHREND